MPITRQLLRDIRVDVDAALVAIAKRHGVLLSMGNASFRETDATMKMNITLADKATVAAVASGGVSAKAAKAEADFKKLAKSYGMEPEWLHTAVSIHGRSMEIAGLLPNRSVNCVLVRGAKGGEYIASVDDVLQGR
jgi:hypothetical protein